MIHRHLYRPSPLPGIWSCARCGACRPTPAPSARIPLTWIVVTALQIGLVCIIAAYAWTGIVFGWLWGMVHG